MKFRTKLMIFLLLISLPCFGASSKIVFIGDSLTDGYGVPRENAYPALIGKKLQQDGRSDVQILNSSISGSTTASAPSRLKWQLKDKPDILVLALGANDGLRGLKLEQTRKNLSQAIEMAKASGVEVILAGMKIPPNYGKEYSNDFEKLFSDLAKKHKITLIPFLLKGVGGEPEWNQSDGIHPNEKGHARMAETVYPYILKVLKK